MNDPNISATVASAIGDAFRKITSNETFEFGEARIIVTKAQSLVTDQISADEPPPNYPSVPTNLVDDSQSWLS